MRPRLKMELSRDVSRRDLSLEDYITGCNIQLFINNTPTDFMTVHHSFVFPDVIFRENMTLYYIDLDKAVFVETDENICVWSKEVRAFYSETLYSYAKNVIIVYKNALDKLLESISSNIP